VYLVKKLVLVQGTKSRDLTITRRGHVSSSWSLGPEQREKERILPMRVLKFDGIFVMWCGVSIWLVRNERRCVLLTDVTGSV
jgi:hypothetical protein